MYGRISLRVLLVEVKREKKEWCREKNGRLVWLVEVKSGGKRVRKKYASGSDIF